MSFDRWCAEPTLQDQGQIPFHLCGFFIKDLLVWLGGKYPLLTLVHPAPTLKRLSSLFLFLSVVGFDSSMQNFTFVRQWKVNKPLVKSFQYARSNVPANVSFVIKDYIVSIIKKTKLKSTPSLTCTGQLHTRLLIQIL